MNISLALREDALQIAKIHKAEIKKGFLSSLPLYFLEKLYSSIIGTGFCITAKEEKEVIGFIAGTIDLKETYSFFIKRYFFQSIIVLLPKILNVRKIIESLFYPNKENGVLKAELLTIAVKKDFQGQGLATKMFPLFVQEMKNRGVSCFKVLVGEDLKPAISFYEKQGFKFLKDTTVHKNNISKIYVYNL